MNWEIEYGNFERLFKKYTRFNRTGTKPVSLFRVFRQTERKPDRCPTFDSVDSVVLFRVGGLSPARADL
jgi:hypothetical protein